MIRGKSIALKTKISNIINNLAIASQNFDEIKDKIKREFKSRGMSTMRALQVLSKNLDLNSLLDTESDLRFLFIFTFALMEATRGTEDYISINLEDYFTDAEIKRWSNYKQEETEDVVFPLTLKNVAIVQDNIWQVILTAQDIHKLKVDNLLVYNFKTQRNPKISASGISINLDVNKVNEIAKRMEKGLQYPDPLILNVLNNGSSKIKYDVNKEELTILDGSTINVVDGFHRIVANSLAVERVSELKFNWTVYLCFLTEDQARDYMAQKDKQKPMKTEYRKVIDYNKPENIVVNLIEGNSLSLLGKAMKSDEAYVKLNQALTTKAIVSEAIGECYEEDLKDELNTRKIASWIVEFTDYLMGELYPDEFVRSPYSVKASSYINHKNMFNGYIGLSFIVRGKDNWKEIVKEKMKSIDFSKKNEEWREIGVVQYDMTKRTRQKLYNYFRRGVS